MVGEHRKGVALKPPEVSTATLASQTREETGQVELGLSGVVMTA